MIARSAVSRRVRTTLALAAACLAVSGLVACNRSQNEADHPLVVYSGRSEQLVAPIFSQFTEETGIAVEVRYGDSAELAAQLLEEGGPAGR